MPAAVRNRFNSAAAAFIPSLPGRTPAHLSHLEPRITLRAREEKLAHHSSAIADTAQY